MTPPQPSCRDVARTGQTSHEPRCQRSAQPAGCRYRERMTDAEAWGIALSAIADVPPGTHRVHVDPDGSISPAPQERTRPGPAAPAGASRRR